MNLSQTNGGLEASYFPAPVEEDGIEPYLKQS